MQSLIKRIKAGQILVSDGAMGTALFEKGLNPGDCPEAMNLTNGEILRAIARSYSEAGADIVQTNTFGGSAVKLSEYGLGAKTEEINSLAVTYVRESVKESVLVSGSCGPSGKLLEPYGDGTPAELQTGFERQISALVSAGVDLICVETMIDINEAIIAVQAARKIAPSIQVIATMTFDPTPRGFFTIMGVSIADAVEALVQAGADVIGSNCGNGLDKMIEIAREFHKVTDTPIIIQSNAGQPENQNGRLVYKESADFFADRVQQLISAGVSIIGGCCGTTPDHIRAIRRAVDTIENE